MSAATLRTHQRQASDSYSAGDHECPSEEQRRLTLDFGLRFVSQPPEYDNNNVAAHFDPALYDPTKVPTMYVPTLSQGKRVGMDPVTRTIVPAAFIGLFVPNTGDPANGSRAGGVNGYPRGLFTRPSIFAAPRFGFAYDLTGDGKTALRGGFGIQREIQRDIVVQASYVGSQAIHRLMTREINAIPMYAHFDLRFADATSPGRPLPDNFLRPYQGYGSITPYQMSGTSHDNALQSSMNRRFSKGFQFGVSYTFSKVLGPPAIAPTSRRGTGTTVRSGRTALTRSWPITCTSCRNSARSSTRPRCPYCSTTGS